MAPGAELIDARALDAKGWGSDSSVLAAVEWAVEAGADVVNLSLGATDTPGISLLEETVNKLSDQALFVIAAGNDGPAVTTVGSPGSAERALTVGAVDGKDALAAFSSRGPVVGDGAVKPEVTAPGVDITAAKFNSSGYQAMSGTSMAAPHVAGAAALLAQQHPGWSGQQIKADLVGAAEPGAYTPYEQGTGRIDVARAIGQTVVAETPALNFGTTTWPHTDDEPVSRTLTYRNYGDAAVTWQLTTETKAPTGLFTLGSDRLTVPAGGTAAVEVTADTRQGGDAAGAYALTVVSAGGGQSVRTPGGVRSEEQMVDVTMTATLRDGSTPDSGSWRVLLLDLETSRLQYVGGENGTATVRVPVSPYMVVGTVFGYQEDRLLDDHVAAPKLRIVRRRQELLGHGQHRCLRPRPGRRLRAGPGREHVDRDDPSVRRRRRARRFQRLRHRHHHGLPQREEVRLVQRRARRRSVRAAGGPCVLPAGDHRGPLRVRCGHGQSEDHLADGVRLGPYGRGNSRADQCGPVRP